MASSPEVAAAPVSARERQRRLILAISRFWAWVFLFALIALFWVSVTVTTDGEVNFLSLRNIMNVLVTITPVLLMGLGQTFVIISGGIDLSVGWVMGLASVVAALVARDLYEAGSPDIAAIAAAFVAGVAVAMFFGLISGLIIAKLRVPSFIVTLGMSFVARGVAFLLSGGNVVGQQPDGMRTFGNESLIYVDWAGGNLAFLFKPEVSDHGAPPARPCLLVARRRHRHRRGHRRLHPAQDPARAAHLRRRRQPGGVHARRRARGPSHHPHLRGFGDDGRHRRRACTRLASRAARRSRARR